MLFSSIVTLAMAPVAMALPSLMARDGATVVKDIGNINSSITTLNNTLNTFRANDLLGIATALKIQQESDALVKTIETATSDTNASQNFTQAESNSVAVAVVNLSPRIQSVLNNIVVKKPAFASAFLLIGDLSKTVRADLIKQSNDTTLLGNALTAKLAAPCLSFMIPMSDAAH